MVSSEEENEAKAGDTVEWDVDMDIQLFYAMANHKPVGINKHFQMACIWEKLSNSTTKEISTHDIWKHLETLYDLSMLDDTEPIPFPNHEQPFCLPESEFGALIKQKCKDAILSEDVEDVRSPSPKVTTPRSSSRGTTSKDSTPKAPATSSQRKDSVTALSTKTRKESGSSHASTDTPSIKSEKDYEETRVTQMHLAHVRVPAAENQHLRKKKQNLETHLHHGTRLYLTKTVAAVEDAAPTLQRRLLRSQPSDVAPDISNLTLTTTSSDPHAAPGGGLGPLFVGVSVVL